MPQNLRLVSFKGITVFLETVVIPALIVAAFATMEMTMLGVGAVLVWRVGCFAIRWLKSRHIPTTSVLTFVVLLSRTLIAIALGLIISSETGVKAYLLPACAISFTMGVYFLYTTFRGRPLVMKLAEDFIELEAECKESLMPVFKIITFVIGFVHVVCAGLGMWIVISESEKSAAHMTSGLAVINPLLCLALSAVATLYTLRRLQLKLNLKHRLADPELA